MLREYINKLKKKYHIEQIGVIKSRRFSELEDYLNKKEKIEFEEKDTEKRINPNLTYENTKALMILTFNYYQDIKDFNIDRNNKYLGKISMSSWGRDYHKVVKELTEAFLLELKEKVDFFYQIHVDTHPLPERYIAKLSGIGITGKNRSLITRSGSFVFLSTVYLDRYLDINYEKFTLDLCKDCNLCIKSCPSGALSNNGYRASKCISYLTQTKKEIDDDLLKKMSNSIYGCDVCQLVCPYNKDIEKTEIEGFKKDVIPRIDLFKLLDMTNRDFKDFENMSMSWRGKNVLKRNALISLFNLAYRDKEIYIKFLNSESKLLRDISRQILNLIENEEENE